MSEYIDFWKFLAGLSIFLFGMLLLEESIKALSGKAFRRLIRLYTKGRLRAIAGGTVVTAVLQSSSAVSLMVLAFVGAGVMSMESAIGVIMGSNIGTTFTAWIVALLGFKVKIQSFAIPVIALGGIGLILSSSSRRVLQVSKLLLGFGFLFLGLDYMKTSVEEAAQRFDLSRLPTYGLWVYVILGAFLTALMQSSSATIAIILTALNTQLINFEMGVAMVIGANIGTTITVQLGAIGGSQPKKRVAASHLLFNLVTGVSALLLLPWFVGSVRLVFSLDSESVMALALFHTLFNIFGVIIFFPFIGLLSRLLIKMVPQRETLLTLYLHKTPTEVTDVAGEALMSEVKHLLEESQRYCLRMMRIDETLVFDRSSFLEDEARRRLPMSKYYENIKLLHSAIFTYYSRLRNQELEADEAKDLDRVIYASRNMINSTKNFKGIRHNLDEFDASENPYLNTQYEIFRRRLVELYHSMTRLLETETSDEIYSRLFTIHSLVEDADKQFIENTINAVCGNTVQEMEISTLLLVNRLFTQACRLQVFSIKDLLLNQQQIVEFDKAIERNLVKGSIN